MGASGGQFGAFFCGIVAFFGCIVTTALPEWSRNSKVASENYLMSSNAYTGLWWRCHTVRVGTFQCDTYDESILGLNSDVQAGRALMVISTIFSFFGVIASLLSLDCTTLVEPDTKAKNNTALIAGICYIITANLQAQRALMVIAVVLSFIGIVIGMISLQCTTMVDNETKKKSGIGIGAGICIFLSAVSCGIAVTWWALRIIYEFNSPFYQASEFKYEFGACIYLGWVATLFGACTLVTTIWFGVNVNKQFYDPLRKSDSFKYEYGSCLYVGWVTGAFTLIAGLVLIIGSCRNLRSDKEEKYTPTQAYVYKPPASTLTKSNGAKAEYV